MFSPSYSIAETGAMYDRSVLQHSEITFNKMLDEIKNNKIVPHLSERSDKELIAKTPIVMSYDRELFAFSTGDSFDISILSMKFLSDLSFAFAWLLGRQCSVRPLYDYMNMIMFRDRGDFQVARMPTPFEAIGIPHDAMGNPSLDDATIFRGYKQIFSSMMLFILSHEVNHRLDGDHNTKPSISNEMRADALAILLLARNRSDPTGAIVFFTALAYGEIEQTTHPFSAQRLEYGGRIILQREEEFWPGLPADSVERKMIRRLAENLIQLGIDYNKPQWRDTLRNRATTIDPKALRYCAPS